MNDRPPRRRNRSLRLTFLIVIGLLLGAGLLFVKLAGPPIPRQITIFTGPAGTPFHDDGPRYQEILARHGIDAQVVPTGGSLDNLERLAEGKGARVGFAESALINLYQAERAKAEETADLVSLGALYIEPFWVFALAERDIREEPDLEGLLVYPGREGSGTRLLAERLLEINGLDSVAVYETNEPLTAETGVDLFLDGVLDAVFVMGEPRNPAVHRLLRQPEIKPVSFRRAEAYNRQFPFVTAVTLPEGAVDLALNIPDEDLKLIASSIQLVTTDDLSPVLVDALLAAAGEIHGEATLLSARGEFPKADPGMLELLPAAELYYRDGRSWWRSFLPFWLATWVDRFGAAFGGIAAFGVGLGILLNLIGRPFGMLLEQMYRRIIRVEQSLGERPDRAALLAELASIDADSAGIWVPPMERAPYLEFRQNIADVRERVLALPETGTEPERSAGRPGGRSGRSGRSEP